jgi:hypothetical protein
MCQLLGMNGNTPTDICFSFEGFRSRGGLTDVHQDGWGIAFFEGPGCRVFLDVEPSAHSAVAELVRHYPIRSKNVIAHIRKATQGRIALENTHPFQRELWGRYWLFAHNGNLKDFAPALNGSFVPVGDTDSELAFCFLLQRLRDEFGEAMPLQPADVRFPGEHHARNFRPRRVQLPAQQWQLPLRPLRHQTGLRRAPGAVRRRPPEGPGRQRRFQRGDESRRPRRRDRHAAADRQRSLDHDGARHPDGIPRGHAGGRGAHRMKGVAGHTARKRFGCGRSHGSLNPLRGLAFSETAPK